MSDNPMRSSYLFKLIVWILFYEILYLIFAIDSLNCSELFVFGFAFVIDISSGNKTYF